MHLDSPVRTLHNGVSIPLLGLGVFRAGGATREAVLAALAAGYRHVDTARIYRNEADVGAALRESGLPRRDVFVTTKLWNDDQGEEATLRACEASLMDLGLDYVDLYLVHWPVPERRRASWRSMERLLREGRCRAIGVSNYMVRHLDELVRDGGVVPAVNQIELHPFLQQRAVVARCEALGIAVEAYSPLTKGRRLDDPRLAEIARELGRSSAQVLLRWSLQKGYVVVAKSANAERIRENAEALGLQLDDGQMARLDALEEGLHTAWDPTDVP
jgi:diketogulonate reductase-like aldo/keto reductase